jgi:hypothetical protein
MSTLFTKKNLLADFLCLTESFHDVINIPPGDWIPKLWRQSHTFCAQIHFLSAIPVTLLMDFCLLGYNTELC